MKRMTDMPLPDEDVFDSIAGSVDFLERMSRLLSDGTKSSMRVVLNRRRWSSGGAARLHLSQPVRLQRRRRDLQRVFRAR